MLSEPSLEARGGDRFMALIRNGLLADHLGDQFRWPKARSGNEFLLPNLCRSIRSLRGCTRGTPSFEVFLPQNKDLPADVFKDAEDRERVQNFQGFRKQAGLDRSHLLLFNSPRSGTVL